MLYTVVYELSVVSLNSSFSAVADKVFFNCNEAATNVNPLNVPQDYNSLGAPSCQCQYCGALLWREERVNKSVTRGKFKFTLCCLNGKIKLPKPFPTPPFLLNLYNDKDKCHAFLRNIRLYNSMFAMSSSGGDVDHSINNGRAPYV